MSNVKAGMFGQPQMSDEDQAAVFNAQRQLVEQRVSRGKTINGVLGLVAILVAVLLVVATFCAAVLIVRATF